MDDMEPTLTTSYRSLIIGFNKTFDKNFDTIIISKSLSILDQSAAVRKPTSQGVSISMMMLIPT